MIISDFSIPMETSIIRMHEMNHHKVIFPQKVVQDFLLLVRLKITMPLYINQVNVNVAKNPQ